ncbi:MAG TPA: IclR family transcriptional regulator, partial [Gaiellaceae bacterium]|nr:IclR family transcriptional regulator [Gaiellaceae bacterium]
MSSLGTPRTKSLGRAVVLLQAVAAAPEGSTASALARQTGLPRSTVARTLRTLADTGLVEETAAGWTLGYELVRLGRAADPHRRVVEASQRVLARLRDDAGETALLAVPRGRPGMEIVLQLDAGRHIGVASWVGVDVPLHASSAGKLVLADLDDAELDAWLAAAPLGSYTDATVIDAVSLRRELRRVRDQGWAELVDELEDGLASLSVPVRRPDGSLAGMIGLSGPT